LIALRGATVAPWHALGFERDSLGVEHPKDIVVGNEQQLGGAPEAVVRVGEERWIHMAVWADQRQIFHCGIERPSHPTAGRLRRKTAVRMKIHEALFSKNRLISFLKKEPW
jgi:hypothetical protein